MIGSLEIAHAQVLAARIASRASHAGVDAPGTQGETGSGAADDVTREEEQS